MKTALREEGAYPTVTLSVVEDSHFPPLGERGTTTGSGQEAEIGRHLTRKESRTMVAVVGGGGHRDGGKGKS